MIVLVRGLVQKPQSRLYYEITGLDYPWSTQDELLAKIVDQTAIIAAYTGAAWARKKRIDKPKWIPRPSGKITEEEEEANALALEYLRQFSPGGGGEGSASPLVTSEEGGLTR